MKPCWLDHSVASLSSSTIRTLAEAGLTTLFISVIVLRIQDVRIQFWSQAVPQLLQYRVTITRYRVSKLVKET